MKPMVIKVTEDGVRGLVNRFRYIDVDIKVGDPVGCCSYLDRQYYLKGSKAIVRRIYFDCFGRYTICFLLLYFPTYERSIWIEADACTINQDWVPHDGKLVDEVNTDAN